MRILSCALVLAPAMLAAFPRVAWAQGAPAPDAAPSASVPAGLGPSAPRTNQADERGARIQPRPGGWTADMAAARARATSFDVAAKAEAVRAAAAKVDQAVVGFFPRLSGVARYTRLSELPSSGGGALLLAPANPGATPGLLPAGSPLVAVPLKFPVPLDNWLIQGTLTVPLSDYVLRVSQTHTAASNNAEAARLDRVAAEAKAESDARLAFYQLVKAGGQREVLAQSLVAAEEHKRDAENLLKAGMTSKADVLAAEANVASGRLAVDQADELFQVAEAQLRALTHVADEEAFTLTEDVRVPLPPSTLDITALKQEALANRPEIRALALGEEGLMKAASAARAATLPRLDAFGDVIYANPNTRIFPQEATFRATWDVGLSLTWSPNDAFVARGAGSEQEANAAKLRAQRAQARDSVVLEVVQAALFQRTADVSVETSAVGVAAAEEAYRVRRDIYRVGKATSVELTDAETNLFRARLVAVSARIDQRIARVRLAHAVGRDVKK